MQTQQAQARMPARLKEATDIMLGDDYKAQAAYMLNNQDIAKQFEEAMKIKMRVQKLTELALMGVLLRALQTQGQQLDSALLKRMQRVKTQKTYKPHLHLNQMKK